MSHGDETWLGALMPIFKALLGLVCLFVLIACAVFAGLAGVIDGPGGQSGALERLVMAAPALGVGGLAVWGLVFACRQPRRSSATGPRGFEVLTRK